MNAIYETTNHLYTVNAQVATCSQCGQRTLQLRATGHAPICDGCTAVQGESAPAQDLAYSPRLHQHLQARYFAQSR